jgi:uncharacterized membrane-anchored protein YhcB (DUF1043 family)
MSWDHIGAYALLLVVGVVIGLVLAKLVCKAIEFFGE